MRERKNETFYATEIHRVEVLFFLFLTLSELSRFSVCVSQRERERERNKKEMRKRENEEELGRRKKSLFPQPCLMSTKLVARMCEEDKISSGSEWELGQAEN